MKWHFLEVKRREEHFMNKMKTLSLLLIVLLVVQFFLPNIDTYGQVKSGAETDPAKLNIHLKEKSETKLQWKVTINDGGEENDGTQTTIQSNDSLSYSVAEHTAGSSLKKSQHGFVIDTEPGNKTHYIIVETDVSDEQINKAQLHATANINGNTYYAKEETAIESKQPDPPTKEEGEQNNEDKKKEVKDEKQPNEQNNNREDEKEVELEDEYIPLEQEKGGMNTNVVSFSAKKMTSAPGSPTVSHTVKETDSENICRRNVRGEITFALPKPTEKKPVDIVVAQDASGSYAGNANQARQSLRDIVDMLDLSQDRMMVTSFRGYNGWKSYNSINDFYDERNISSKGINWNEQRLTLTNHSNGLSNSNNALKSAINQIVFDGATPSASGLQFAKERYEAATRNEDLSNRNTIFLFITDGVANAQLDGLIHIEHNRGGIFNPHVWAEQYQFYEPTFAEVVSVANDIKVNGYDIISAYWENAPVLRNAYGSSYYNNTIGPAARQMVQDVASKPEYYSSNEDLAQTISELLANLQEALNKYDGFKAEFDVAPGFELVEDSVYVNGTKVGYTENGNNVTVTLDEIKSGESTLTYELRETSLHTGATEPITNGSISYDKDRNSYKETVQIPQATLKGNKNLHNCQENVSKLISPVGSNDYGDYLQIDDVNEVFTYKLQYQFGGDIGSYETVKLRDDLESVLQVVGTAHDVEVHSDNIPQLDVEKMVLDDGNGIEIVIKKKNNSYNYLAGKTITVLFQAKVRDDVTNDDLAVYEDGNIPNVAKLLKDDDEKRSNEVHVSLPQKGSITVHKVDEEKEALQGATFTLTGPNGYKKTGVSDADGVIRFSDLPLGTYTLKETKAPEGYRLLEKEMTIDITANNLHVEKEIENTLANWEIPKTGGIGTLGFYSIGLLLMMISVLYYKRKKFYLN